MAKRFFALYFGLLVLFVSLLTAVCTIPTSLLTPQLVSSAATIRSEGIYPITLQSNSASIRFLQRDQFTDEIMLNIAASVDSDSPFRSALISSMYSDDSLTNKSDRLEAVAKGLATPNNRYDRYWHGYLVFLRPLLTIMDYKTLRWFSCLAMAVLLCFTMIVLKKRLGWGITLLFLGILALAHIELVPYSLQFASVFYVAFASITLLLWNAEYFLQKSRCYLAFFAIGAVTVFLDFLTAPTLTLGLPAIFWLMIVEKNGEEKTPSSKLFPKGFNERFPLLQQLIFLSLAWGCGYALMWASKWGLCYLTFDTDVMNSVSTQASAWSDMGEESSRLHSLFLLFKQVCALVWSLNWMGILTVIIGSWFFLPHLPKSISRQLWLIVAAMIPVVWSFVLTNHVYTHSWFTWRAYIISFFAISLSFIRSIDWKSLSEKTKKI